MDAISGPADTSLALRNSRIALGLSQEEFARRLGVSFATVNRWERGRSRPRGVALARLGRLRSLVLSTPPRQPAIEAVGTLAPAANEFVGRSSELAELDRLVRRSRLVTVVGPVGGGKTRLVSEALRSGSFDRFGAIAAAAFSAVARDDDVAAAVARQVGAELNGDLEGALVSHLGHGGLLVLDNCEHVLDGCRTLVRRLLAETEALHIVTTSREPLGHAGEAVLRIAPLAAADASSPAVELFVARAGLSIPGYQPDGAQLADIGVLCGRLDGLPLAIELAAGCLPDLQPAELIDRLDERFELLVDQSVDAAPRQRELRAAIGASFELLGPREGDVLDALSVFGQPFTLDAAEAVAGQAADGRASAAYDGADVLLNLAALAAKSLIEVRVDGDAIRYTMLESIRAYAHDRLVRAGRFDAAMANLWDWSRDFAERAERGMAGREQQKWIDLASRDADTVAASISWAIERGDGQRAVDLAGTFWRYWYSRSDNERGGELLAAALSLSGPEPSPSRAKALLGAGVMARQRGDFRAAVEYLRQRLALAEASGDQRAIAEALNSLAGALHGTGDSRRAAALLRRSLDHWEHSGDRRGLAAALSNLGVLASDAGDQAAATDYGEQALALRLSLGHAESIAISYENIATAALRAGDRVEARRLFGETLRRYEELDEPDGIATAFEGLAAVVSPRLGLTLLEAAQQIRTRIGVPRAAAADEFQRGLVGDLEQRLGKAAATLARRAGAELTVEAAVALVAAELAQDPPVAAQRLLRRRLSRRERQVLELAARGQTAKEMAAALGVSVRTIDRHLANIYAKIGARGRAEAIAFAVRTENSERVAADG